MVSPMVSLFRAPRGVPNRPATAEEMEEVKECAEARRADRWPTEVFERWGVDPAVPAPLVEHVRPHEPGLVNRSGGLVQMDMALELFMILFQWLLAQGVPIRRRWWQRRNPAVIRFVYAQAWIPAMVALKILQVLVLCFIVKWRYGVARPNEYFARILGPYTHPGHPGWIAGHGSVAGVIFAMLMKYFDFTAHVYEEEQTRGTVVHWSFYRTTGAQVHRMCENAGGVIFGSAVGAGPFVTWKSERARWVCVYPEWDSLV